MAGLGSWLLVACCLLLVVVRSRFDVSFLIVLAFALYAACCCIGRLSPAINYGLRYTDGCLGAGGDTLAYYCGRVKVNMGRFDTSDSSGILWRVSQLSELSNQLRGLPARSTDNVETFLNNRREVGQDGSHNEQSFWVRLPCSHLLLSLLLLHPRATLRYTTEDRSILLPPIIPLYTVYEHGTICWGPWRSLDGSSSKRGVWGVDHTKLEKHCRPDGLKM